MRLQRIPRMCGGIALLACAMCVSGGAGQTSNPTVKLGSVLSPAANRPPDANEQMLMRQRNQRRQNFDAANALRLRQIDDDTRKLLILAADLKRKLDAVGDSPVPPQLAREAEVVELLARDVQTRMKMTIGSE